MKTQIKSIVKNFSYALSSNLLSLVISSLTVLVVPKFLGIEEYGYFQLYIFYSTYTALLHFGWIDGIYLRFAGARYNDLEKNMFYSQFWMLSLTQITILLGALFVSVIFLKDVDKIYIIRMMIVSSTIVIPKGFLQYILQGTNRIKEYSRLIISEKAVFSLLTLFFILSGTEKYQTLIAVDIISKISALLLSVYYCKDIVLRPVRNFKSEISEVILNISVGINLLIAYITGSSIIGVVRFAIEKYWDVGVFGKISLTLNISNLFMIFINSLSVILFPVLRRVNPERLVELYNNLRTLLMNLSLGLLIAYYPAQWLLKVWLPNYAESLEFMILLFPIMVFEGKMNLLVNTYLKTLRKEKAILIINLITLSLSVIATIINVITVRSLDIMVLSITLLLCFRSTIAEIFLAKQLQLGVSTNIIIEISFVIMFILISSNLSNIVGVILYTAIYFINLYVQKNSIFKSINYLKGL